MSRSLDRRYSPQLALGVGESNFRAIRRRNGRILERVHNLGMPSRPYSTATPPAGTVRPLVQQMAFSTNFRICGSSSPFR